EQDLEAAGCSRSFHLLAILHLSARKRVASMGQSYGGAGLLGQARGSFKCAVAATHHQHVLLPVLLGVDQAINHFGLVFAFYAELARRSTPADSQQHRHRQVGTARCPDLDCGAALSNALDLFAVFDLQAGPSGDVLPNLEQLLLAHRFEFELSAQGQSRWRCQNYLAARKMRNGAAEALLLDRQKTQPVLDDRKTRRKTCWSGAHNDH